MRNISIVLFLMLQVVSLGRSQYVIPERGHVFQDQEVPRVDITLDQDSLDILLHPSNIDSNHEYPASFKFTTTQGVELIEEVGFRLRGNTSRSADKKSFKISFNSFISGQKFYGLEKLNLNGEHNDPSIMRSKLCWDFCNDLEIPSSRANHIALYVNDVYRGLYINVEHIDEEFIKLRMPNPGGNLFKCLYPADLVYLGGDPALYQNLAPWGRQAYDLKTNTTENDYSRLAYFINVLNNTATNDFKCKIEDIFDVDNYLKAIVMDVLTSNWDGPIINKNNFYLYHDPVLDRFTYIPFDLDNTLGIDFFGVNWAIRNIYNWDAIAMEYRPLYKEIMKMPEYRNRFSYYLEQAINDFFSSQNLETYIDTKLDLVKNYRVLDTFAMGDYGYTYDDFISSYTQPLGNHATYGLKDYTEARVSSATNQLVVNNILPFVKNQRIEWTENLVTFYYTLQSQEGDIQADFHYTLDGVNWMSEELVVDNDGQTSFVIDVLEPALMTYFIELEDQSGVLSYAPHCQDAVIQLGYSPTYDLVINEFMASNTDSKKDEYGEQEDWIEIFNNGDETVPLFDYYLSDDPKQPNKWKLPAITMAPGEYVIIWADNDDEQGSYHANFKLDKDGEFVGVFDDATNHFAVVDSISFGPQQENVSYARFANGVGDFDFASYPTFGYNNDAVSGILQNGDLMTWSVFPNPSNELLFVDVDQKVSLSLYDIAAREQWNGEGNYFVIKVDHLIEGMYFLKIEDAMGNIEIEKIVIY